MKRIREQHDKMLVREIAVAGRDTARAAKSFVPVQHSNLKNSITTNIKGMTAIVGTRVQYAPYVEFGTGFLVNVPSELKDYAMQFKGKGLRQVNTGSRPYLYPAFFINREKLVKRLDKKTEEIFRKNSKR